MSDDPTRLRNQPALTTASGNSWLVIGAAFSLISIGTLTALATFPPAGLAVAAIATIVVLYVAMVIVRFAVARHRRRLGIIAALFLSSAAVGLGAVIAIASAIWAPL
ncbi:MAG: hypothetical protein ACOH1K_01045 [Rhodoglobus sp.]